MALIEMREGYNPAVIRIHDRKKNRLYEELSLIAFDRTTSKILATGNEAMRLIDTEDENISVVCPLRNGLIADFIMAQCMFRILLQNASLKRLLMKPSIAVVIPGEVTEVEAMAFKDVFYHAGAKKVLISGDLDWKENQSLPLSYEVAVEIIPDRVNRESRGPVFEKWKEESRGQIPPARYKLHSIDNSVPGPVILLTDEKNPDESLVRISFSEMIALRLFSKEAVPDGLFSEEELEKHRKNRFSNVLYEIEEGQFGRLVREKERGNVRYRSLKQYLIITENQIIEILAKETPCVETER